MCGPLHNALVPYLEPFVTDSIGGSIRRECHLKVGFLLDFRGADSCLSSLVIAKIYRGEFREGFTLREVIIVHFCKFRC